MLLGLKVKLWNGSVEVVDVSTGIWFSPAYAKMVIDGYNKGLIRRPSRHMAGWQRENEEVDWYSGHQSVREKTVALTLINLQQPKTSYSGYLYGSNGAHIYRRTETSGAWVVSETDNVPNPAKRSWDVPKIQREVIEASSDILLYGMKSHQGNSVPIRHIGVNLELTEIEIGIHSGSYRVEA